MIEQDREKPMVLPGGPVLRYLVDLSRLRLTYSALG